MGAAASATTSADTMPMSEAGSVPTRPTPMASATESAGKVHMKYSTPDDFPDARLPLLRGLDGLVADVFNHPQFGSIRS